MPLYTYECEEKHTHEITHSIKDCDIERLCPTCSKALFRVLQNTPFILSQDGGWHRDEYSRTGRAIKG